MTDIVKRLRQVQGDNDDAREAADEIERLRNLAAIVREQGFEIERLRAEVADRDRIMNMSD